MLDAGQELDNLRNRLIISGLPDYEADEICDNAFNNIRETIIDIVSDALQDAVSSAENGNSHDFIKQVMAVRDGTLFKITTTTGKTDFSEPPFPMLPRLLENAKVAKDGSRYKKIPMRKKIGESSLPKTIESAIVQINNRREQLKAEKKSRLAKRRGAGSDPVETIPTMNPVSSSSSEYRFNNSESVATEFRTASDKQDPSASWVMPAKNADMTEILDRINNDIQDRIDDAIRSIISSYGGSY